LDAGQQGEHVVIRVSDNVIGIARGLLSRMFDPFIQADRLGGGCESVNEALQSLLPSLSPSNFLVLIVLHYAVHHDFSAPVDAKVWNPLGALAAFPDSMPRVSAPCIHLSVQVNKCNRQTLAGSKR